MTVNITHKNVYCNLQTGRVYLIPYKNFDGILISLTLFSEKNNWWTPMNYNIVWEVFCYFTSYVLK